MRGMGDQKPAGLTIARELWLDENGRGLTFRDHITGAMQQIWRLDAAAGQDLGSVRSGGQGQLITRNPQNDAPGVEIRTRNLNLEATGRMDARDANSPRPAGAPMPTRSTSRSTSRRAGGSSRSSARTGCAATGSPRGRCSIFSCCSSSRSRSSGSGASRAALLAFLAFGLAYHEPGAPRYLWLVLLVPLALQRVVPEGWGRRLLSIGKWIADRALPARARALRRAAGAAGACIRSWRSGRFGRPDLRAARALRRRTLSRSQMPAAPAEARAEAKRRTSPRPSSVIRLAVVQKGGAKDNLLYDAKARIQTGPGVPEWKWREVSFGWNGPVSATQQVKPVLISLTLERVLTVLRVVLLLALAAVLLGARRLRRRGLPRQREGGGAARCSSSPSRSASAQSADSRSSHARHSCARACSNPPTPTRTPPTSRRSSLTLERAQAHARRRDSRRHPHRGAAAGTPARVVAAHRARR